MVDFNNETTVTRPAADIVRVLILQRRNDVIDAFEYYRGKKAEGIAINTSLLQKRMFSLFLELQATLKRRLKDPDYKVLLEQIKSTKYEELYPAFLTFNEELDRMKLITIDTGKVYDSTRVEAENRARNL